MKVFRERRCAFRNLVDDADHGIARPDVRREMPSPHDPAGANDQDGPWLLGLLRNNGGGIGQRRLHVLFRRHGERQRHNGARVHLRRGCEANVDCVIYAVVRTSTVAIGSSAFSGSVTVTPPPVVDTESGLCASRARR